MWISHLPLSGVWKPLGRPKVTHCHLICQNSFNKWNIKQGFTSSPGWRVRRAISLRQESDEGGGECAQYWVGGERGVDEIEDELWTGGEDGDGRLTTYRKNHLHRIILRWTCQAAVGRQEWGREAIVGKSLNQPSSPQTWNLTFI